MNNETKKDKKDKKERQSLKRIVSNNAFVIGRVVKYCPMLGLFWLIDGIIYGVFNSIDTLYIKLLFDAIDKQEAFGKILLVIAGMAVIHLLIALFRAVFTDYFKPQLDQKLHKGMQGDLFRKAQTLDISCYDDPVFYNDFVFAMDESDIRVSKSIEDTSKLISRTISSITTITIIMTVNIWLAVVVLLVNSIAAFLTIKGNKVQFNHSIEGKPIWRKRDYIKRVFYLADYAKEIRISRVKENLLDEYDKNNNDALKLQLNYGKKYFAIYGGSNLLRSAVGSVIMLWMSYLLIVTKTVMLGGFAAGINALWKLSWFMRDMASRLIKYPEHSLYIEKYRTFLAYEPKIKPGENETARFESLELRNVNFNYGFAEKAPDKDNKDADESKEEKDETTYPDILKNVNMTIKRGDKIAIVGYNGAGKTTLIKLLMRLYDVTNGEILWNGGDIRSYTIDSYRGHIGAVFQDYKIFSASVGENVLGGDYDGSEESQHIVREALSAATFTDKLTELEEHNKGLETMLSKEFDNTGVNLSGGEAQKVAIARVFARPYDLIIMDEPSSALDPIAEFELNHSILEKANDKTVIFISHRLSTTKMADRIYMFADGEIAEQGSHDELMAMNGKYAEMFNLQAEKYRVVV